MRHLATLGLWSVILLLAACNLGGGVEAPKPLPTSSPIATFTPLPSLTPLPAFNPVIPTSIVPPTSFSLATSIPPAPINPTPFSLTRLLTNGTGLSTGRTMQNGEIEVEGYCAALNQAYGVEEDGRDWYCIFNGQRALTLRVNHFTDICQRTYHNAGAYAVHNDAIQPWAFGWRCYENTITATPTVVRLPVLLTNGIGMSTGRTVTNGEFEVEGYCSAINPNYGVDEDGNYWYCTVSGRSILTLGQAEFDDICFRTYRVAGAFAVQQQSNVPAYGWRCYAYVN